MSDYLINQTFKKSKDIFKEFVQTNLAKSSLILEGCSIFLYSLSRNTPNVELKEFIESQEWYNSAFLSVIFSAPDSEITDTDKQSIKNIFLKDVSTSKKIILELAYHRYNTQRNKNLNINLLFEIFENLSESEFENNVYPFYQGYGNTIDSFIDDMEKFLENFKTSYHSLFKFCLYFSPLSYYRIKRIYYRYYSAYYSRQHLSDLLNIKNGKIVSSINEFIIDYDIQL